MEDKQLDKLFKDALYDAQEPVGEDLWHGIDSTMRRAARRRLIIRFSSVAAVLVAALFVFAPYSQKSHISEMIIESSPENEIFVQPKEQNNPIEKTTESSQDLILPAFAALTKQPIENTSESTETTTFELKNEVCDSVAGIGVQTQTADSAKVAKQNIPSTPVKADAFEWDAEEKAYQSTYKKYAFAFASSVISGGNMAISENMLGASAAGGTMGASGLDVEQVSDTKYSLPLNLAAQIQVSINDKVSVGFGLSYTMLRSKYDGLVNKKMYNIKQTLHYIGVPVNFYATLVDKNNFLFYANAGGVIEKGLRASYALESYNGTQRYHTEINGIQFSLNAGLGVEYKFTKTFGLYLEPNVIYFFNSKVTRSIRTDQPLQLKAEIGCRFHL